MVRIIARKELLLYILNTRFAVVCLLCMVLAFVSSYVMLKQYEDQLSGYRDAQVSLGRYRGFLGGYNSYLFGGTPKPLSVFVQGLEGELGRIARIDPGPEVFAIEGQQRSEVFKLFSMVDLLFVIKVILGLFVVAFVHDAICGERERGTLKLTMANAVPRDSVLLGKLLGGFAALLIPLVLGFLCALAVFQLSPAVAMEESDWARVVLIFLVSVLYVFVLLNISLFVSCRTERSETAMVVLLVVWVASVLIVPNLSILVARRVHPTRSRRMVDIQKERFYAAEHEKNRKINRANYLEVTSGRMQWSEKQRIQMLLAVDENLKLGEMEAVYQNEITAQSQIARVLSRLSPACLYQYACETLAGTGFKQYGKFMDAVKRYRRDLLSYLKAQSGRTSLIGSSPPVFRFSERLAFRGDLPDALLDIGLLMLLGVAFFMAAYASFLRYDVA